MNKLLVIILVSFCVVSVLTKSIKVSDEEDDDENSDEDEDTSDNNNDDEEDTSDNSENNSDEDEVPEMDSEYIPNDVSKFTRKNGKNLEFGEFFQGDIEDYDDDDDDSSIDDDGGTGLKNKKYRWPKEGDKIIVTYKIDSAYNERDKKKIMDGIKKLEKEVGCLQFKEQKSEKAYIHVEKKHDGCSSPLGRRGNMQSLNLASGCLRIGTVMHEFIHALGFGHTQSHTQRDKYVKIIKENIEPSKLHNFNKMKQAEATNFGTPYDYYSVMHYPPNAFSTNRKKTIETIDKKMEKIIGQRNALSPGDIARIQKMYECPVTVKSDQNDDSEGDDSDADDDDDEEDNEEDENKNDEDDDDDDDE